MIGHWPGSSKVALNSWRTLEDWLQPQANDYSLALDRDDRSYNFRIFTAVPTFSQARRG